MEGIVAYDFYNGQDYKERILEIIQTQFSANKLFLLSGIESTYLSSIGFQDIIKFRSKEKEFWRHIEKFPKAVEKMNLDSYPLVISVSEGPMHWVKKNLYKDSKDSFHIAYSFGLYPFIWDETDRENPGTFWNKFTDDDREYFQEMDLAYMQGVDLLFAADTHTANRLSFVHDKDAVVLPAPVSDQIFFPKEGMGEYFLIQSPIENFRGLEPVIEVFNYLKDKLVIIGEGSQKKEFRKMARENISFIGNCDESERAFYLKDAIASIVPDVRHYNHFARESLAMGIPLLAHKNSSAAELIEHRANGFLFKEFSSDAILESVLYTLEQKFDKKRVAKNRDKLSRHYFREQLANVLKENIPFSVYSQLESPSLSKAR